jgi:hypothetical protein
MLIQDNATKWNSAYIMIDRIIKKRINVNIYIVNSIYEIDKNKIVPIKDRLTDEDWLILSEIHEILKSFYNQTKRFQSRAIEKTLKAAWEVYLSCEYLFRHILTKKRKYARDYEFFEAADSDEEVRFWWGAPQEL